MNGANLLAWMPFAVRNFMVYDLPVTVRGSAFKPGERSEAMKLWRQPTAIFGFGARRQSRTDEGRRTLTFDFFQYS
jgi:hypothetical protein